MLSASSLNGQHQSPKSKVLLISRHARLRRVRSPAGLHLSLTRWTSKAHTRRTSGGRSAWDATFKEWFESLPSILAGRDLRRVVDAISAARKGDAGIVWGIGAHVIKTGVSPVLIDLMRRGYVSALAMNGAGIIHDFEIALGGIRPRTSTSHSDRGASGWLKRPVGSSIEIIRRASAAKQGIGQAVGAYCQTSALRIPIAAWSPSPIVSKYR